MDGLEGVQERGPVFFSQYISPDLHDVIWSNAQNEVVECSVVDGTHGYAVGNDRFAAVDILSDMGSVEKLRMTEPTERALMLVRAKNTQAEKRLMKSSLDDFVDVLALQCFVGRVSECVTPLRPEVLGRGDGELLLRWFFCHKPHGTERSKNAGVRGDEPDKGLPFDHRLAERSIVVSIGICSTPLVSRIAIRTDAVFVWAVLGPKAVCRTNGEGSLKPRDHTDASHVLKERDSPALELEGVEFLLRHQAAIPRFKIGDVLDRSRPKPVVEGVS
jgi:hypothetical protein